MQRREEAEMSCGSTSLGRHVPLMTPQLANIETKLLSLETKLAHEE